MIFGALNRRKFDISSLYIFPPYLYTVATLPWEIQKSFFNSIIHTFAHYDFWISQGKMATVYRSGGLLEISPVGISVQ